MMFHFVSVIILVLAINSTRSSAKIYLSYFYPSPYTTEASSYPHYPATTAAPSNPPYKTTEAPPQLLNPNVLQAMALILQSVYKSFPTETPHYPYYQTATPAPPAPPGYKRKPYEKPMMGGYRK
ncbi:hypothetical protein HDE_01161 [Halotydeus destructor]|nr:hypothetical protein HDE_01161 [Halotydeus destructor]